MSRLTNDGDRGIDIRKQIESLREVREGLGITQTELANILNMKQEAVSRKENGTDRNPMDITFYIQVRTIYELYIRNGGSVRLDAIILFYNLFYKKENDNIEYEIERRTKDAISKFNDEINKELQEIISNSSNQLMENKFASGNETINFYTLDLYLNKYFKNVMEKVDLRKYELMERIKKENIEYVRDKINETEEYLWVAEMFNVSISKAFEIMQNSYDIRERKERDRRNLLSDDKVHEICYLLISGYSKKTIREKLNISRKQLETVLSTKDTTYQHITSQYDFRQKNTSK